MKGRMTIIWVAIVFLIGQACQQDGSDQSRTEEISFHKLQGQTMGTTWHITYEGDSEASVRKSEVDSLLNQINQSASTYIPTSIISRLNEGEVIKTDAEDSTEVAFFRYNANLSKQVWEKSNGYFDPTVMPLVNYWGFGYTGHRPVETVDPERIDSLLQFVGYGRVADRFDGHTWELPEGCQLDFSAVAKGAACDWIGRYFEGRGIANYLIEIGGEMLVRGPGRAGGGWIVGVSKPRLNAPAQELIEELAIRDKALATSGNYRNYYKSGNRMISHTINPKTGYSEEKSILSATIIAENCGMADALATAVMAMGLEDGQKMLEKISSVEAYLIYNNGADSMLIYETEGMDSLKYTNKP